MSIIDGYAQEMRRKKQKSTKIYVVTCGTYSDYHIEGIFSSKAKANAYIKKYGAKEKFWDTPIIEEWILTKNLALYGVRRTVKKLILGIRNNASERGLI